MSDGNIAVTVIFVILLVALILYGIAFLLFLKVEESRTFLPAALFPCVNADDEAAQMEAEKQAADDAVTAAQAAVAAAEASGDADALAAGQQALTEAQTKAQEAAHAVDVAVAKCTAKVELRSAALDVEPMTRAQEQQDVDSAVPASVKIKGPSCEGDAAINLKVDRPATPGQQLEEAVAISTRHQQELAGMGESMDFNTNPVGVAPSASSSAFRFGVRTEVPPPAEFEIPRPTFAQEAKLDEITILDDYELSNEALKRQLAEHEAEQKRHTIAKDIIAKEFVKAGELEEKMKAIQVEMLIQREGKAEAAKITALDNCELSIEALKRQLAEHEAEQKKHIIAKEFAKAGELEEKMKAIKAEVLIQKEIKAEVVKGEVDSANSRNSSQNPLTTDDITLNAYERARSKLNIDLNGNTIETWQQI